ncbi:MAG TPA: Clp protease N-terminal domain-containing protein [Candidatus Saccharimonadales bacterium]|nr:Clp protease N-terminal domain-containing protein [Candidatus Saccharimonadales bacterium]
MFERFTYNARRVILLAQDEARRLDHQHINPKHILLGLISDDQGVVAQSLTELGVSLEEARRQVKTSLRKGQGAPFNAIPWSAETRQALEWGYQSSVLRNELTTPLHLLYGLTVIKESADILVKLGLQPSKVQRKVVKLLDQIAAANKAFTTIQTRPERAQAFLEYFETIARRLPKYDLVAQFVADVVWAVEPAASAKSA